MKNEELDKQIISIIMKSDGKLNASRTKIKYFIKHYQSLYEYLNTRYDDLLCIDNFSEILYRVVNQIEEAPICPICGKKIPYTGKYHIACSSECQKTDLYQKILYEKRSLSCIKKYGVSNPFQAEEIKDKMKKTWIKNYGVDHPNKCKSQKEKGTTTYKKTYKEHGNEIMKKRKTTCLEKYGCENYRNIPKTQQTNLERYGVTNVYQTNTCKNKIKEKYGVDNVYQNEDIKQKIRETKFNKYGDPTYGNRKKAEETNLLRYGVREAMQNSEISHKSFMARVKNGSIGKSKIEKIILNNLIKIFPNTQYQYKDELYPFHCDYYIPEYKVYIELQGNWTHGMHPFNINDINDINKLNKWKQRSEELNYENVKKDYYIGAIQTWTIYDPLKRETANINHLNYLEIFSCNEIDIMNQIHKYFLCNFNFDINKLHF